MECKGLIGVFLTNFFLIILIYFLIKIIMTVLECRVTCSSRPGSVVVDYTVAVLKDEVTQTLGEIIESVKTEAQSGTFGSFKVDPASVTGTSHRQG